MQISGNYNLPRRASGIDIALLFVVQNGLYGVRTNNYTLPNIGTIPVMVGRYGAVSGPIRDYTSMRFSRNFKFKSDRHGTLRPTVELLNLTNTAGEWAIQFYIGSLVFGKNPRQLTHRSWCALASYTPFEDEVETSDSAAQGSFDLAVRCRISIRNRKTLEG